LGSPTNLTLVGGVLAGGGRIMADMAPVGGIPGWGLFE
jgi:hypothetical protein